MVKILTYAAKLVQLMEMDWDNFNKAVDNDPVLDQLKPYIISSILPHQQDKKMQKDGIEPPRRWAEPGEEDETYTKIVGSEILINQ